MKKVALAQIKINPAQLSYNYNNIFLACKKAVKEGCNLIVFPSYCLSGITLGNNWLNNDFVNEILQYNKKVLSLSKDIDIIFGSIAVLRDNLISVAYYCRNGSLVKAHNGLEGILKADPSSFSLFREEDYFFYGTNESYFEIDGKKIAVALQEDINVNKAYDYNFILSYKPYLISETKNKGTCFYVNPVGSCNLNGNIFILQGKSGLYKDGKEINVLNNKEGLLIVDINENKKNNIEVNMIDYLIEGIKEYDNQLVNKEKYIINFDGSTESYINIYLLCRSVSTNRIEVFNTTNEKLPFNVVEHKFDINEYINKGIYVNDDFKYYLMKQKGIVVSNANKTTYYLGLYPNADIGLLCDLDKTQVNYLAKLINKETNCIKINDLKVGLVKWYYHDYIVDNLIKDPTFVLDFMQLYQSKMFVNQKIGKYLDEYRIDNKEFVNDLEWVVDNFYKNKDHKISNILVLTNHGIENNTQALFDKSKEYLDIKEKILK